MNMTNEVRTAAYTLMQRHLTEPFANDEERRLVLRQADDACEILAAWLDAQDAAEERWEPVESDMDHPIMDADGRCMYWTTDGELVIEQDYSGNSESIVLPDDLRLCRRVEVQP